MEITRVDKEEMPLSRNEQRRLAELEAVVDTNLKGYINVGMALAEIRDSRLYRFEYKTFDEYMIQVWDVKAKRAYQLIKSAEAAKNLEMIQLEEENQMSTMVDILPTSERQIRPLVPFSKEEQIEIWKRVLDTSSTENIRITSDLVEKCVREYKQTPIKEEIKRLKARGHNGQKISAEMDEAFRQFVSVIETEINNGWRNTSKKMLIENLRALLAAAEEL